MKSKYLIPRLLSGRDRLSRQEKDVIRDSVLGRSAPARTSRLRAASIVALAGAAVALVVIPLALRGRSDEGHGEFASRGSSTATARFTIACAGARPGRCRQGQKLLFDLSEVAGYRYFAAFGRRGDGTILWYFPDSPGGQALDLGHRLEDGVLDRGVVLGGDHAPGRYQVYGVFSNQALDRPAIKDRFERGAVDVSGTAIVARELEVE